MASCDDDFSLLGDDQSNPNQHHHHHQVLHHTPYAPRRFNPKPSNQILLPHHQRNGDEDDENDVVVEASSAFHGHGVNPFTADENSNPYDDNNAAVDEDEDEDLGANRSRIGGVRVEKRQSQEELSDGGTTNGGEITPYGSFKRPRTSSSSAGEYRKDREEWSDAAIACLLDAYSDKFTQLNRGNLRAMFGNIKSLAYYESNKEDPYITLHGNGGPDDDEDEDREDLQILATDNLLLAAKVEDEMAHLEVYVYEDSADNLYVHHDIMLPAIPLCVEWLDIPVQKAGVDQDSRANFVAIGTMDPDIEVWDLDTIDSLYPNAILGQAGEGAADKKKKKKKARKANDEYHVDAVLALAANRKHRNLLASASADKTVKLWDLHTAKCAKSYSYHTDKVCSLAWHSIESTVLLSGSYDRTVVAADMRAPEAKAPRWGVESDVENIRWDPHDPNYFYVSTENGIIHFHDVRNAPATPEATKAVWTLQAHDESVSSFDINPVVPGFMATGSTDKTVKLWNIQASGPSMVVSRNLDVGKVFSTQFAPDPEVAFRLAVAGSRGTMHVWDTSTNAGVRHAFAERVPQRPEGVEEDRLVGVLDDDSSSSEDEDEGEEGEKDGDDSMDED